MSNSIELEEDLFSFTLSLEGYFFPDFLEFGDWYSLSSKNFFPGRKLPIDGFSACI